MRPTLLGCVLSLAFGCALAQTAPQGEERAADAEEAAQDIDRSGQRCISTLRIRRTEIVDERTVLFHMNGGRVYRNYLSYDCPSLVRERRFSYEVTSSQLCSVNFITVLEGFGSRMRPGMSCGLGLFYEITEEEAELLTAEPGTARDPSIVISTPDEDDDEDEDEDSRRLPDPGESSNLAP